MIKVLSIVPSLARSAGVSRFAYNLIMNVDNTRIHIDVLHGHLTDQSIPTFDDELKERGHAVFEVTDPGNDVFSFIKDVKAVMNELGNAYDIAHCNVPNAAWCYLKEAENAGIRHRIQHSHSNKSSDIFLHRVRNAPLIQLGNRFATERFACSKEAGEYLFGKQPFHIINNGIPLDDYAFNNQLRKIHRSELGIPHDALVFGCVGRIVPAKNLVFAIEVFEEIVRSEPKAYLVIVGDGPDRQMIETILHSSSLEERVKMTGARDDVNEIYSAFDLLLMPSLTEGLPFAAVEAQASGLRCLFSSNVPPESDITGKNDFLPLAAQKSAWAEKALSLSRMERNDDCRIELTERGFSSKQSAATIAMLYEEMVG